MIGGYYESAELLAYEVANIIEDDDLILIKRSVRNSNFEHLILYANSNATQLMRIKVSSYGVATFSVKQMRKFLISGIKM